MEKQYYIWTGGYSGNAFIWWGIDSRGYTSNLDKAGKYTEKEAIDICSNMSRPDMAFLCSHIDGVSHRVASASDKISEWGIKMAKVS